VVVVVVVLELDEEPGGTTIGGPGTTTGGGGGLCGCTITCEGGGFTSVQEKHPVDATQQPMLIRRTIV
jgi:hypothetical protein